MVGPGGSCRGDTALLHREQRTPGPPRGASQSPPVPSLHGSLAWSVFFEQNAQCCLPLFHALSEVGPVQWEPSPKPLPFRDNQVSEVATGHGDTGHRVVDRRTVPLLFSLSDRGLVRRMWLMPCICRTRPAQDRTLHSARGELRIDRRCQCPLTAERRCTTGHWELGWTLRGSSPGLGCQGGGGSER